MSFNYLTTTIRGFSKDLNGTLQLDSIHKKLTPEDRAEVLSAMGHAEGEIENRTHLCLGLHHGVQAFFNIIDDEKNDFKGVILFLSENAEKCNKRDLYQMLEYTAFKCIPTVLVKMTDDGKLIEALQQLPMQESDYEFNRILKTA